MQGATTAAISHIAVEQVKVRVLPDGRVSRADAAKALGRTVKTLSEWHRLRIGPRGHNVGGRVFYDWEHILAFQRGEYVRPVAQ